MLQSIKDKQEADTRAKKAAERKARQKRSKAGKGPKLGLSINKNALLGKKFGFITKLIARLTGKSQKNNLSYKRLHKMISTLHPTDPETLEKLDVQDDITVNKYGLKLIDAIGCLYCLDICKRCLKLCKGLFAKKQKKFYVKPETMKDVPDSDSDSEANDTFKGLSSASIYLGEGAVMYLQMMKTFAVLFFILTIINIPIFLMFSSTTVDNNYLALNQAFQYFTIGNIGKGNDVCSYSNVDFATSSKIFQ